MLQLDEPRFYNKFSNINPPWKRFATNAKLKNKARISHNCSFDKATHIWVPQTDGCG